MHEADWEDLKVQLGQFSTKIDSNNFSIGKVIKIVVTSKKILATNC